MTNVKVDMQEMAHSITMNVEFVGVRRFTLRLHLASLLMKLAAWVAGFDVRVTGEDGDA